MVILKTQGLKHQFGDSAPLSFTDLTIAPGDRVLLKAPSGSGKTTLLSLISGILPVQNGDILFNGESHSEKSARQLDRVRATRMGLVFQTLNLLPYLSALDNTLLPLKLSGLQSKTHKAQALEWADRLGLSASTMARKPTHLSQGQQQRVAILRALLHKPALILADEPTSALDPDASRAFLGLLLEQMSAEQALLLVSHDPSIQDQFDQVVTL